METTVEKLEAMFLKAEADLDYIEKRLKLDFINSSAENGCPAEVKELTSAQKESVDSIRNNLSSVMELLQHFEQTTDMEFVVIVQIDISPEFSLKLPFRICCVSLLVSLQVETLTESERESVALLSAVSCTTAEVCSAVAASHQEQPQSSECEELTAAMLESLPSSVRSNIKLADLNAFYQQLQQHLGKSNRGSLSVQKMKQLKMNVSDAKLKVLQQLSLVELDSKGHVRLVL
ncbi:unnamed protein product [Oreochromis niloticus]|nr:unnamed protein product [Mustela putorius furo]